MSNICCDCPRRCKVDRSKSVGYCKSPDEFVVSRSALHLWEEPSITGKNGSGTIFFSGCNLGCVYCQNYVISRNEVGKRISDDELLLLMKDLQDNKKATNINLVTPTHYIKRLSEVLKIAKDTFLKIPVVYNSSGYEEISLLKQLNGLIDVYMPDFKYFSNALSQRYSNAKDYPSVAKKTIDEMFMQVGRNIFDQNGNMINGLLVRHLVLPTHVSDSKKILLYLHEKYKNDIYLSIMSQYTPFEFLDDKYCEIKRKLYDYEYNEVVDFAISLGIENAYIQEGDCAKESFIPNFINLEGLDIK